MADRPTPEPVQYRCRRGAWCSERVAEEHETGPRRWVGAEIGDPVGLCSPCRLTTQRAVRYLPGDYSELSGLLSYRAASSGDGLYVSRGKGSPPVPINLAAEALQRAIDHEAVTWLEVLTGADTQRLRVTRPAVRVAMASRVLLAEFARWMVWPPYEVTLWDGDEWSVEPVAGIDAALRLLRLHERVASLGGRSALVHRSHADCPACSARALRRENGSEWYECGMCGELVGMDAFARLVSAAA
jgi:hypothetical protein